ncbi:MAG: phosphoribosylformylglycinamidine synthase, purS protein [Promethearchaeota archaeon]|nr:MAG: phosphoribosylformylglycinamidine synthase, purS protein [Candidatus Lokiarchaeota archaeon]
MDHQEYIVEVVLENKPQARDPVGTTIQKDLLAKKGYNMVSNVRSGQYLRINISAANENEAKKMVNKMCNDLRIFNPVTQNLTILKVIQKN